MITTLQTADGSRRQSVFITDYNNRSDVCVDQKGDRKYCDNHICTPLCDHHSNCQPKCYHFIPLRADKYYLGEDGVPHRRSPSILSRVKEFSGLIFIVIVITIIAALMTTQKTEKDLSMESNYTLTNYTNSSTSI
ncbi:DgyrCDS2796 [Dimorphilus gyrociliatus]|uniref:DgyrCDS2796 n=1 Tax=Dimorphilus gyrociliatus TaxID=2664684 RepID=A0A7I8VBC1_9ANNE|nr:DgyrCDS2796 [Dimorphilus gyrociliatus]